MIRRPCLRGFEARSGILGTASEAREARTGTYQDDGIVEKREISPQSCWRTTKPHHHTSPPDVSRRRAATHIRRRCDSDLDDCGGCYDTRGPPHSVSILSEIFTPSCILRRGMGKGEGGHQNATYIHDHIPITPVSRVDPYPYHYPIKFASFRDCVAFKPAFHYTSFPNVQLISPRAGGASAKHSAQLELAACRAFGTVPRVSPSEESAATPLFTQMLDR